MDQLDLLKKDWKKQDASLPRYSQSELSKLIHKKSSSIVKWIFIISVLEFVIPHIFLLFFDNKGINNQLQDFDLTSFYTIISVVFYGFVLVFIYLFYRNYKSISANSNPKILMQNILKTRKTVKYYIWVALSFIPVVFIAILYKMFQSQEFVDQLPEGANMTLVWVLSIILMLFIMLFFWLIYQLIYGFLLRKLKANYNELIKDGNGNL